jgi:hypothetical protein
MMMVPDLRPPHPGKERFGVIRAGIVERIGFLVIDPLHDEAAMQGVPRAGFVGVNFGALGGLAADEIKNRQADCSVGLP